MEEQAPSMSISAAENFCFYARTDLFTFFKTLLPIFILKWSKSNHFIDELNSNKNDPGYEGNCKEESPLKQWQWGNTITEQMEE